ncbi:MAG: hypothetical protein WCL50_09890 [Spirochaetota bacterium]
MKKETASRPSGATGGNPTLLPGESTQKDVRCLDLREDEERDEAQFAAWVQQAAELPGHIRLGGLGPRQYIGSLRSTARRPSAS